MTGRVKGDTLQRIWTTFQQRGHNVLVAERLLPELVAALDEERLVGNHWYSIDHYLELYGTLLDLRGYDEVVATASASVTRALQHGSWRAFVPVLAGLAPDLFCQRGIKRFETVYKVTFEPGYAEIIDSTSSSADVLLSGVPYQDHLGWRGGVSGGLIAITRVAGLEGRCLTSEVQGGVLFALRWR